MSYDKPGIIGPNYKYHKQIKSADEMGMGTDGDQLDDNIAGLGAYAGIIFDGRSNANKSGYNRPLGNSFFIKTGQTCKYGEDEVDMLDLAFGLAQTSRLGCQIEMSDALDGLRVSIPEDM
mgnify:CR=1 FL=1